MKIIKISTIVFVLVFLFFLFPDPARADIRCVGATHCERSVCCDPPTCSNTTCTEDVSVPCSIHDSESECNGNANGADFPEGWKYIIGDCVWDTGGGGPTPTGGGGGSCWGWHVGDCGGGEYLDDDCPPTLRNVWRWCPDTGWEGGCIADPLCSCRFVDDACGSFNECDTNEMRQKREPPGCGVPEYQCVFNPICRPAVCLSSAYDNF